MKTVIKPLTVVPALIATLTLSAAAHAAGKPTPKVTPAQAKAAAVKKVPGKALSAKYEFEDGHWQYAVLVKNATGLTEVEVDAKDAHIWDTEKTTMADEKAEDAADAKAANSAKSKPMDKEDADAKDMSGTAPK